MKKPGQFITTQKQLKKFLHDIDTIVDEYHPHIYLNDDLFDGLSKIHDAVNKQVNDTPTMKEIVDKEFLFAFVLLANESYKMGGSYEDVYDTYESYFSDEEILAMLDYCEENNLLEC